LLDIKYIRENPEKVKENALNKGVDVDLAPILELEEKRRKLISATEPLQHLRKAASKKAEWFWKHKSLLDKGKETGKSAEELRDMLEKTFGELQKVLEDSEVGKNWTEVISPCFADPEDVPEAVRQAGISLQLAFSRLGERLGAAEAESEKDLSEVRRELRNRMLEIPNLAMEDVPVGGEDANKLLREWGEEVCKVGAKPHWDIGESLGMLDTKLAAKLAGSNFALFRGAGAKLVRSLMQFMLDTHSASGYLEVWPPVLANREVMTGAGQLPKFEEDMYRFEKDDMFLIPTAEVPLTAMHGGEILQFTDLPLKYCAYTPCFRREAGAYGRETRGLLRVHQFDKVEILKVTTEEQAADELEGLLADAEGIIQKLGLRYRVQLLSTREMTFASERTYDIEIWSPGVQRWLEVSSVSSFGAFQARRLSLRYRDKNRKVHFCRTMNGSGVAFARLIACLLETYQREDGSVEVPEALRPYFGADRIEKT
jgi:seryl-tRNA synthetase